MNAQKIEELESKLSYQEDHLQELNHALHVMQKQLDNLELTCQVLKDKMGDMESLMPTGVDADEKPPHY